MPAEVLRARAFLDFSSVTIRNLAAHPHLAENADFPATLAWIKELEQRRRSGSVSDPRLQASDIHAAAAEFEGLVFRFASRLRGPDSDSRALVTKAHALALVEVRAAETPGHTAAVLVILVLLLGMQPLWVLVLGCHSCWRSGRLERELARLCL